jgi:hypothetical protein
MDRISMCSNTLFMSNNMDARSSLRWLSASTMTLWHHFDSISDPEPHNLSQVVCSADTCLSLRLLPYARGQHINVLKHFVFVYVKCGCRKLFEVAISLNHDKSHHFDYTSDPEPQNLSQVVWVKLSKAPTVCPSTAYQCAQTHFMSSVDTGSCLRLLSASSTM